MRAMAEHVTHLFAPSHFVRDRFVAFGIDAERISVSEYGWALPPLGPGDAAEPAPIPAWRCKSGSSAV